MCYHTLVKVEEYIQEDGSSPYKKWFDALDAVAAAKVSTAKMRMERGLTPIPLNGLMELEST